jgi:uncharacterized protein (DUF302 family)
MTSAVGEDVITKTSNGSVDDTVARLSALLGAKGLKIFLIIDHSGEAANVGMRLRETKVVIFGSPHAGTPVMVAAPLAALDMPLKVLVWDDDGQTRVSYTAPSAFGKRFGLSDELVGRVAAIEGLTSAWSRRTDPRQRRRGFHPHSRAAGHPSTRARRASRAANPACTVSTDSAGGSVHG